MLLAEFEVWHTRPRSPTRRLALGHLMLPCEPAPGFGGLLLGAVVARHVRSVDDDLVPDLHRLIEQVDRGERVLQPRLRNRFQVDRHGLSRSIHRMVGEDEHLGFEFDTTGTDLQQVLAAVYATERLAPELRRRILAVVRRALVWRGPIGPDLVTYLAGTSAVGLVALADPRSWALEVLGFPPGTVKPSKSEVVAQYRHRLRQVHPDHGGDVTVAGGSIGELGEARRILLTA